MQLHNNVGLSALSRTGAKHSHLLSLSLHTHLMDLKLKKAETVIKFCILNTDGYTGTRASTKCQAHSDDLPLLIFASLLSREET